MAKKKRLTIKQLFASCKRNLDPPARLELIFQLLFDLPQREFGYFADGLFHEELSQKFQKTDTVIMDKDTFCTLRKCANEYGPLKAQLARWGTRKSRAGMALRYFVWTRGQNGRTAGEAYLDARKEFPGRKFSKAYIKKIMGEGRKLGFA